MVNEPIAPDGWPKVGRKPCSNCGKQTQRQADGLLYDPVKRADGSDTYERHLCARPK